MATRTSTTLSGCGKSGNHRGGGNGSAGNRNRAGGKAGNGRPERTEVRNGKGDNGSRRREERSGEELATMFTNGIFKKLKVRPSKDAAVRQAVYYSVRSILYVSVHSVIKNKGGNPDRAVLNKQLSLFLRKPDSPKLSLQEMAAVAAQFSYEISEDMDTALGQLVALNRIDLLRQCLQNGNSTGADEDDSAFYGEKEEEDADLDEDEDYDEDEELDDDLEDEE